MTENKRYELTFMDCFYITDHQTKDYASVLEEDLEEVVNRLNEQHETINELKIENRELNNEVKLLCEFFRNSDFTLDDFNKWLTEDKWKWEAKEVLEERFGDFE